MQVQPHTSADGGGRAQEYLYELATAVRELYPAVEDRYLFELDVSEGPNGRGPLSLTDKGPLSV